MNHKVPAYKHTVLGSFAYARMIRLLLFCEIASLEDVSYGNFKAATFRHLTDLNDKLCLRYINFYSKKYCHVR